MPEFQKINVVGLGYIGLPTAALIASRGMQVVGVDTNERIVDTATSDSNADSSTVATFTQALREATSSNRSFSTTSDSWEFGGGFGLFGLISASGGRGGASTSGNADGSQSTSRDLVKRRRRSE